MRSVLKGNGDRCLFITSFTWAAKVEVTSQVGWHFIYVRTKNVHCTYIRIMLCIFHLLPILYNLPNEPQVTEHLHYQYFDKFSR